MAEIKVFNRWPTEGVQVQDPGLRAYINVEPRMVPKSSGRLSTEQFYKSKMGIVERLMNRLMVAGHRSKKHVLTSGRNVGKLVKEYKIVKETFERIEKATKKNPIEVLVGALENSALREETAAYQVGGMIVRRAVITSPQRRVDMALRNIVQIAYRKSFGKKENAVDSLSSELIAAYNNDATKSEAVKERTRVEKEAEGAR